MVGKNIVITMHGIKRTKLIEKKDGKIIFKEAVDEMPPAMKRMMSKIEKTK